MNGELIVMAIVMLIGQVILMGMWNANWFKRENFKITKSNTMAQNRLQLRKMEKDLGLKKGKELIPEEKPSTIETLSSLAPLLSKLNPDTIDTLIDKFTGSGEIIDSGGGGGLEGILDNIPPELIESFLKGLSKKDTGEHVEQTAFPSQV